LSEQECLESLGYTDLSRHDALSSVLKLVQRPPFTAALHGPLIHAAEGEYERLRARVKPSRLRAALPGAQRAVIRYPDDPELRVNLANLFEAVSDFAGAEREWKRITELWPHSAPAYFKLASMHEFQNRPELACEGYEQCLKRESDSLRARLALSRVLIQLGRFGEAREQLDRALRQDPGDEEAGRLQRKLPPK
jgi:tetratricopeptide (TPR) repeat protein